MDTKYNVGLVGVGHLGRFHLEKLQKIESCNLYGFHDIDHDKSKRVAEETGAHAAESLDELLERCDIISVVVPTSEHYKVGKHVLEAGKHMFMEKPITGNFEQGQELVEMASRNGIKVGVGHIERFNPAVMAMKGKLGKPGFIEAHRLNPFNPRGLDVAVILELMIHDIDLCLYFTGSEIESIHASAVQVLSDKMDIANARLTFKSGCVANLTASRISPAGMRKIRVFQKDNYLSFDLKAQKVDRYSLVDKDFEDTSLDGLSTSFGYWETGKKIVYHQPQSASYDMLEEELRQFIASVRDDTPPPVSGDEGLEALRIALEIEKKARESLDKVNSNL
jgi:predicted dehydrogenase